MKRPENIDNKRIGVYWVNLQTFGVGTWKSECPFCESGLLLVGRDKNSFALEERDICRSCGQRVVYRDITHMRQMDMGLKKRVKRVP